MNTKEYLEKMKAIQTNIIEYLDDENDSSLGFQNCIDLFDTQTNSYYKDEIISLFHLLSQMSANHHQTHNFFDKIIKIINFFREQINHENKLSDSEICNIFKNNKNVLLLLQGKKINYNEDYLYHLIKNDLVEEFITYVNRNNLNLTQTVLKPPSNEMNCFLIDKNPTLIECAAFFGSIQIFQFLIMNNIDLTPSIWIYVIHSNNAKLIHRLEDYHIEFDFIKCLKEAIKCHHNNIAEYILNNYIDENVDIFNESISFYNFAFIDNNMINENSIYDLCELDYSFLIKFLLQSENKSIDLNKLLHIAISNEYIQTIKYLILNPNINLNNQFNSPLLQAIMLGNEDIVKLLLSNKKINVNLEVYIKSKCRKLFLLNYLVQEENIKMIKLFLEREDINVNCSDEIYIDNDYYPYYINVSPLFYAILKNNLVILELLLSCKSIDINCKIFSRSAGKNKDSKAYYRKYYTTGYEQYYRIKIPKIKFEEEETFLNFAIERGNLKIIKLLITRPDINILSINICKTKTYEDDKIIETLSKKTAFEIAFENDNVEIMKYILNNTDNEFLKSIQTPLISIAVKNKKIELFDILLQCKNIDINAKFESKTALQYAVDQENISIVKQLLTYDELNINNRYENKTALHTAVENQNVEIIRLLLSRKDLDFSVAADEKYPLIIATEKENLKIIKELLKYKNIDVNCRYQNKTSLHIAIEKQNKEIIQYLFSLNNLNVKVIGDEKPPLIIAIENDDIDTIKKLLSYDDLDVNASYNEKTAILIATEKERIDIIILLLERNDIDVNARYQTKTSLHIAVEKQNNEIFLLLITQKKINVNIMNDEKPPLIIAIENRNLFIIEHLLACKGLDVNAAYGYEQNDQMKKKIILRNALYLAVENNDIELVKILLTNKNHKVDIKFEFINKGRSEGSKSSLDLAKFFGNKEIINLLEKYKEEYDKLPIFAAIENDDIDIIKDLLIHDDFDVNITSNGKTALHLDIEKQNIIVVKLLLSRDDLDVNAKYNNKTALHIAIEKENKEIIQLLLSHHIINLRVDKNEKPLLYASVEKENIEIVNLLLKQNAPVDEIYSYEIINQLNKNVPGEKSALFLAIEKKNIGLVKALLTKKNHDFSTKFRFYILKNDGYQFQGKKNVIDLANSLFQKEIVDLLKKYQIENEK